MNGCPCLCHLYASDGLSHLNEQLRNPINGKKNRYCTAAEVSYLKCNNRKDIRQHVMISQRVTLSKTADKKKKHAEPE